MKLFIFSGDYENHNGERKFRGMNYDKSWMIFNGKTKISTRNSRKNAGKCIKSSLAVKQSALACHPPTPRIYLCF